MNISKLQGRIIQLSGCIFLCLNRQKGASMNTEILVAGFSLAGTLLGSLAGIMTANKLTVYRLEQLEEKVKKHNNLIERMVAVEQSTKSAHHRLDELVKEMED